MVVSDKCNKDNLCSGSITPSLYFICNKGKNEEREPNLQRSVVRQNTESFLCSLSFNWCPWTFFLSPLLLFITNVPRCATNKRLSALIYGCASFRAEDRDVKMSLEAMVTRYVNVGPIKTCSETCGTTRMFNTLRNIPTLWGFSYFIETLLNNVSSTCS